MNRVMTAALGIALAAVACTATAAPPAGSLDGRAFLSVDVTVNGVQQPLVADTRLRLSFQDGSVSANAGCNHMGGEYRLDNGRLMIASLATTEMGCDPARHAQDEDVARWLTSQPQVRLNGPELILEGQGFVIRLLDQQVADPARPLVGTRWVLTTIVEGDAAMSVPEGVMATLELSDDGNFSIQACNQGGGRYTLDGGTLSFSDIILTRMACQDARGQVEAAMLAVLESAEIEVEIEGDSLMLTTDGRGLGFSAQPTER